MNWKYHCLSFLLSVESVSTNDETSWFPTSVFIFQGQLQTRPNLKLAATTVLRAFRDGRLGRVMLDDDILENRWRPLHFSQYSNLSGFWIEVHDRISFRDIEPVETVTDLNTILEVCHGFSTSPITLARCYMWLSSEVYFHYIARDLKLLDMFE